ncbi:MAG: hypothetical protein Q8K75_12985 [Chlamydiales bacterium]|nr:hypothetical protein [Chlamydiales bacterium]
MRRTIMLLMIPLVAVGLMLAVRDPIQRLVVRSYLIAQVEGVMNAPVIYTDVHYDGSTIILDKPVFMGSGGAYSVEAEQLRIHYDLSFTNRQLNAEVELIKPTILLTSQEIAMPPAQDPIWWRGWLRGNITVKVDQGAVAWRDGSVVEPMGHFTVNLQSGLRHPKGAINIVVDAKTNRTAQIVFEESSTSYKTAIKMHGIPAKLVAALIVPMTNVHLPFHLERGVISGNWSWDSGTPSGQLTLDDVMASVSRTPLKMRVKEGKIACGRSPNDDDSCILHLQGALQLISGASASTNTWELEGFKGQLNLGDESKYSFSCRGQWWHADQVKAMRLDGTGTGLQAVRSTLVFLDTLGGEGRVELSHQDGQEFRAKFSGLEASEAFFFKEMLGHQLPEAGNWQVTKGRVEGILTNSGTGLNVDQLVGTGLEICHNPCGWRCQIGTCRGKVSFGKQQGFRADLNVTDGELAFGTVEGHLGLLTNVQGHLGVGGDAVVGLDLKGQFPLSKGVWALQYKDGWHVNIVSNGQHVALLAPQRFQARLAHLLADRPVAVDATIRQYQSRGVITLGDSDNHQANFSFDLANGTSTAFEEWLSTSSSLKSWFEPFRNFFSHGSLLSEAVEVSDVGYRPAQDPSKKPLITNGRIETTSWKIQDLFEQPIFAFDAAAGIAKVKGSFDSTQANLAVHLTDMALDNSRFAIEPATATAQIALNFDAQTASITFPFNNLVVNDKRSGLKITDVSGTAHYQKDKLVLKALEGSAEGVLFVGDVSSSSLTRFDEEVTWSIAPHTVSGTFGQITKLLGYFDGGNGLLHKLPLQGVVALKGTASSISAKIDKDGVKWEGALRGEFREGSVEGKGMDVAIRELTANFSYDFASNALGFSDVQGTVLAGRPGRGVEEYRLVSDRVVISDYPGEHLSFDIWVGDKARDLLRVVGEAHARHSSDDRKEIQFAFDNINTHFGNVHPRVLELRLRDWSQVASADFQMDFDLSTVLRDLQRLGRAGLPFLSKRLVEEIQSISTARGAFSFSMKYDRGAPILSYRISGKDIALNDRAFQKFYVNGNVQGNNWIVEQFIVDDLSLSADLLQLEDRWKVNFLGMRCAKAATLGLDGEYFPDRGVLEGRLNLLEMNMGQLGRWGPTQRFAKRFQPKGDVRAHGHIQITALPSPDWLHVEARLESQMRSIELSGVRLRDTAHVPTYFDTDTGIIIRNLSTAMLPSRLGGRPIAIDFSRLIYDINQGSLSIEGGRFKAPDGAMGWVADALQGPLGKSGHQLIHRLVNQVSSERGINGNFAVTLAQESSTINVNLDGGVYTYNGQPYTLRDLSVNYDPYELKVGGLMEYRGRPVWLTLCNECPPSPFGQLMLSDVPPGSPSNKPMVVSWEYRPDFGFFVQRIDGQFFGFDASLKARSDMLSDLEGKVWVNLQDAAPLMSEGFSRSLQSYGLKARYLLDGTWKLGNAQSDWVNFEGSAKAEKLEIAGYLLDSFTAGLQLTPKQLKFADIVINDPAGKVSIAEASLTSSAKQDWYLKVPSLNASNVSPAALKKPSENLRQRRQDIAFPELTITNLAGNMSNLNSLTGDGSAHFTYSKKKKGKGILGLTSEFMSRLGLDWDVLTPSSGSVEYQIGDGKVTLTRLKDVYSHGKLTKYSLPKDGKPSTIDFDGNLDLTIKLRPHQPLLKVTDKMTLVVEGNLKKPVLTVQ